jgi:hypothetical protein
MYPVFGNLKIRYHAWVQYLIASAWQRCKKTYAVAGGWHTFNVFIKRTSECFATEEASRISVLPVAAKGGYERYGKHGVRNLTIFRSWRRRVWAENCAVVDKHLVLDAAPVPDEWLDPLPVGTVRELDRYADGLYEAAWVVKGAGYALGIQYGILLRVGDHLEKFPYAQAQRGREYRKRRARVLTQAGRRAVALAYDARREEGAA